MAQHEVNELSNDPAIDRALREALDVKPSADFVARVRTRIGNEPAPRSAWSGWMIWTPVAAAAVAAVLALAVWVARPEVQVKLNTRTATSSTTAPSPTGTYVVSAFPPTPLGTGRRTVVARKEPEILISQSESAALRRLIAGTSEGEIVVNVSADETQASAGADIVLEPLPEIQPIKIDPIIPADSEEGGRE